MPSKKAPRKPIDVDLRDPKAWVVSEEEKHLDPATTEWECLVYSRVSTGRQVKSRDGTAVGSRWDHDDETKQKELLNRFFDDPSHRNFRYIGNVDKKKNRHFYFDVASGYLLKNRSQWEALFTRVEKMVDDPNRDESRHLCVVACYSDRIGRNIKNYIHDMMYFHDHSVQVFVVGGGYVRPLIHFGNSPQDELQYITQLAFEAFPNEAQIEGQTRHARDDTEGWVAQKRAYFGSLVKYGYKLNPAKYKGYDVRGNLDWDPSIKWRDFVIEPKEAFIVRHIFEEASGWGGLPVKSPGQIADELNNSQIDESADANGEVRFRLVPGTGVKHRSHKKSQKELPNFTRPFVLEILKCRTYVDGHFTWRRLNSVYKLKAIQNYVANRPDAGVDRKADEKERLLYSAKAKVETNLYHDIPIEEDGKPVEVFPPIIGGTEGERMFDQAAKNISDRTGAHWWDVEGDPNLGLFAGLFYCGICGRPYCQDRVRQSHRKSRMVGGYRDTNSSRKGSLGWFRCDGPTYIPYAIDDVILSMLRSNASGATFENASTRIEEAKAANTATKIEARRDLRATEAKLQPLMDKNADYIVVLSKTDPMKDPEMYAYYEKQAKKVKADIDALRERARILKTRIREVSGKEASEKTLKKIAKMAFSKKPLKDKRAFIRNVVDRIYLVRMPESLEPTKKGKARHYGDPVIVVYLKGDDEETPLTDRTPDFAWRFVRFGYVDYSPVILAKCASLVPPCLQKGKTLEQAKKDFYDDVGFVFGKLPK